MTDTIVQLQLPLGREVVSSLQTGQACELTGPLYTLRDAGHQRLLEEMGTGSEIPYGLCGQTIFYAGPTPPSAGRPFGAIGPTTASRMDFATPKLLSCGLVATVGKGTRSEAVRQACMRYGAVYFVAVGGAAAFLAKCVESCETLAYDDLGTEALRKVVVRDFPVFVGIDVKGNNIYSF